MSLYIHIHRITRIAFRFTQCLSDGDATNNSQCHLIPILTTFSEALQNAGQY